MNFSSKFPYKHIFFWILFIVLFSSGFVFFKTPFEFYFHYLFFLTITPIWIIKYGLPKIIFQILFVPLIIGLIHVSLNNNSLFTFIKIFGGILLTLIFYHHTLSKYKFDVKKIFEWYIKFCYLLSLIGLFQLISFLVGFDLGSDFSWFLNKWKLVEGGVVGIRVNSLLSEPTYLATSLAPAVYVSVKNLISKNYLILKKYQSIIILFVVVITTSSIGYLGILLSVLLCTKTIRLRYIGLGVFISIIGFGLAYNNVDDFKARVDSAKGLWIDNDFKISNTNNSSFVLYNNLHIAYKGLLTHPFFGTGLGSHEEVFKKYTLTKSLIKYDFEFNVKDGNSLFIRLCTETGIFGLIFILILIFKCFIYSTKYELESYKVISQSLFILLVLSLIRQGNYMLNGLPLVFLLYYFNFVDYRKKIKI